MDYTSLDNKTLDKLKYDLVRDGLVSYDDIEHASELAYAQNTNIGQILINTQMIDESVLMKFLEEKLHTPSVDLENYLFIDLIDSTKFISKNGRNQTVFSPIIRRRR